MSTPADLQLLSGLQALLQQLEAAQGGEDPEARARLEQLRQQLAALQQAKERAAAADAACTSSAAPADANQEEAGAAAAAGTSGPAGDPAVLQHIDGLEARLQGLEEKLARLDEGSRVLLVQSAAGWLGELQGGGEGGEQGGEGGQGPADSGGNGPAGA